MYQVYYHLPKWSPSKNLKILAEIFVQLYYHEASTLIYLFFAKEPFALITSFFCFFHIIVWLWCFQSELDIIGTLNLWYTQTINNRYFIIWIIHIIISFFFLKNVRCTLDLWIIIFHKLYFFIFIFVSIKNITIMYTLLALLLCKNHHPQIIVAVWGKL